MSRLVDEIGQFTAVPNEFIEMGAAVSDEAFRLLVLLRYYTNGRTGDAFPDYALLQRMTGWRREVVAKAIRELIDSGWVVRQKRFGTSPIYRVRRPPSSSPVRTTEDEQAAPSSPPVRTNSSPPVRTEVVHPSGLNLDRSNKTDAHKTDDKNAPAPKEEQKPTPDAANAWDAIKDWLELSITSSTFRAWIAPTKAASLKDGTLTLVAPTSYAHDWLNGRLRGDIERAARQALNTPTRILITTGDTHT